MAVYTEVSIATAQELLSRLGLGELATLEGSLQGIENTNYFLTSVQGGAQRRWVLTLFERLGAEQLPFYLGLMQHLAQRGLPAPNPVSDKNGQILHQVQGKPAALVNHLPGKSLTHPNATQCAALGQMLARMHLAARDYNGQQANLRGLDWCSSTATQLMPHLDTAQGTLLRSELAYQHHIAQGGSYAALPRGAVHADLFRDNALFDNDQVSGVFDFYFAAQDTWLFDLAVCLNDWAMDPLSAQPNDGLFLALLQAYQSIRPLTQAERSLMGAMLRSAALRFWLSRLWDLHAPRDARLLQPHDPAQFERVLRHRIAQLSGSPGLAFL